MLEVGAQKPVTSSSLRDHYNGNSRSLFIPMVSEILTKGLNMSLYFFFFFWGGVDNIISKSLRIKVSEVTCENMNYVFFNIIIYYPYLNSSFPNSQKLLHRT